MIVALRNCSIKQINKLLSSREPDWYWGLFVILFTFITIRHVIVNCPPSTSGQIYYALPLFKFFHIPDPYQAKDLISEFLSITLSLKKFFDFLKIIFIGSLSLSVLGLCFQKFFLTLSGISFFLFQGYLYGFVRTADNPYVYHSANIVVFILLIWLVAPSNPRWTVYFWLRYLSKGKKQITQSFTYPKWPRLLIVLTMGASYFGSFYCKLMTSGFQWINGHTLQTYLLSQSQKYPLSYGYWLATQNFYIIWFLNIGVWVFQSTAPIGLLLKKTRLFYGTVAVLFHTSVFLFFGFNFTPFQYFLVIFIPELIEFITKISSWFYKKLLLLISQHPIS